MEKIKNQIIEFANTYIQDGFKFREYQLEEIEKIISRVLETDINRAEDLFYDEKQIDKPKYKYKKHISTVNAPTGSGKSLILMISAGVLYHYYNKKSYILVSDTYLWKQYDDFLVNHPKLNNMFASIKGQQNPEYICTMNGENVTKGSCKIKGISWIKMSNDNTASKLGFRCTNNCPYLSKRKNSQLSPITIMTYHLWCTATCALLQPEFDTLWKWGDRDVTFCDESHNVPTIFGNIISITLSWSKIEKLIDLVNFSRDIKQDMVALNFLDFMEESQENISKEQMEKSIDYITETYPDNDSVISQFKPYFIQWDSDSVNENPKEVIKSLKKFQEELGTFILFAEKMLKYFNQRNYHNNKDSMSTSEYLLYELLGWLTNFNHDMDVWMNLSSGNAVITKNINKNKLGEERVSYTFRDADEANIVAGRLLTRNNVVLTSATTGPQDISDRELGINLCREHPSTLGLELTDALVKPMFYFDNIPNLFDYSKSPINVVGRWNMGMKYRDKNLPSISDAIYKVCQAQPNNKGIIHTHTYSNAKYIYDNAPVSLKCRMLLYNDSKDKHHILEQHINSKIPTILIGPTLSEGVDMPGDLCRFLIIMKMPYPYLGDDLVKAKIRLFPYWYNFTTTKTIIQSIGRGNRFKDDWCKTYILDSAFIKFYNENKWMFPVEIQKRMRFYK